MVFTTQARFVSHLCCTGNVHVANAKENADLFWAVRGAGPNFGIVTQFTLQLHVIGE